MMESPAPTRPLGYTLAIAILVLIAVAKPILMDSLDPDCFWHLRVAEQMLADGVGPLVDDLSFASIKQPWTPYSWLAELGMLGLWNAAGWRGAVAAHAAMTGTFVLLIAACCRQMRAGNEPPSYFNTVVATALACVWSLAYLSFRPATLAIVLLAASAWLILRDRRYGERTLAVWAVVPMAALLVNIHLSVILLPLWFFYLTAGAWWEHYRLKSVPAFHFKRYLTLALLTSLASLATPMLPGVIATMGHYQSHDVLVASGMIAEMLPFYHGTAGAISAVLICLVLVMAIRRVNQLRTGEIIWLVAMVFFLFRWGRFAPLFAIIAAPVAAAVLPKLSDSVLSRRLVVAAFGVVLLIGSLNVLNNVPPATVTMDSWLNRHAAYATSYPAGAADFVAKNVTPRSGRLINEFTWGGYLEWRLGDRFQVLMDGRTQLFSSEFWKATYLGTPETLRRTLMEADGDVAIVPKGEKSFAGTLLELGWTVAWSDEHSQVLLPPGSTLRASVE